MTTTSSLPDTGECEGQAPVGYVVRFNDEKCFYWERAVAEWKAGEFADKFKVEPTIDAVYATPTQGQPAAVAECEKLAEKVESWSPPDHPIVLIARERRMIAGALRALTRSVEATDATINNPLSDSRVGVEAGEPIVWLVEWPEDDNVPVRWWNPVTGWMRDANKALWFARERDAADYIAAGHWVSGVKPTQHKFVSIPSAPGVGK